MLFTYLTRSPAWGSFGMVPSPLVMSASTCTSASMGSAATAITVRAGRYVVKKARYTSSTTSMSRMSRTKTVILATSFSEWSMLSTMASRFSKHCSACSKMPPSTMAPVSGSMGS